MKVENGLNTIKRSFSLPDKINSCEKVENIPTLFLKSKSMFFLKKYFIHSHDTQTLKIGKTYLPKISKKNEYETVAKKIYAELEEIFEGVEVISTNKIPVKKDINGKVMIANTSHEYIQKLIEANKNIYKIKFNYEHESEQLILGMMNKEKNLTIEDIFNQYRGSCKVHRLNDFFR